MLDPWVVGVLVNLAGNICINIGTNCVKYDHGRSRLQHHTSSMGSNSSVMSGEQLLDNAPNSAMAVSAPHRQARKRSGQASGTCAGSRQRAVQTYFSNCAFRFLCEQANLQGSFCSRLFTPVTSCWSRFIRHGRWWYVGWSFFTIGNIGNFVSFSFASQSLLAGLGSSQFLMNCICEWYFNDQRITSRMLKATLMIIIGNTLIVAFASHASLILTVDVILSVRERHTFLGASELR
jgi:hypothetical protein